MPQVYGSARAVFGLRHLDAFRAAAAAVQEWPGWQMDLQAAEYWAALLIAAVSEALSGERASDLAAAYLASLPDGPQEDQGAREAAQAAADWLATQGFTLETAVQELIADLIADGYLIGAVSADAVANGTDADTGNWQPGDTDAAQQQAEALGVGAGFAAAVAAAAAAATQVAGSFTLAVAGALAAGAAAGHSAAVIGAAMRTALKDTGHASAIALDHVSAAASTAARALYTRLGILMAAWLTEDATACPVCQANAAAGEMPIGSTYPSGDVAPPAHPHCRCALVPATTSPAQNLAADRLRQVLRSNRVVPNVLEVLNA